MPDFPPPLELLRALARRVPGAYPLGRWLHRRLDRELRAIERSRWSNGAALFQPFPDTCDERYPALFDALAARLAGVAEPRLLSFGCSTGAEPRALRRRLPTARIVAMDANPRALARAARADRHPRSEYRVANRPDPDARFDAILALAVFRHGELEAARPESCAAVLPFSRFAAGVAMLDACLAPGGWLTIANAHFRFTDTAIAARYTAAPPAVAGDAPTLLYGPDDRRLPPQPALPVLFRKR